MELAPPELFSPEGATAEIVEQVDRTINEINSNRPIDPKIATGLYQDLFHDRIHSSAVTEGNRLSRRETIVLLSTGIVEAGSRKDRAEVENLGRAVQRLDELVHDEIALSPALIRELHTILGEGLPAFDPGTFRTFDVAIAGSETRPPAGGDVLEFVESVSDSVTERLASGSPLPLAAWTHWAITRIHPFRDGNGRVARLLQDFVLLRREYLPVPLFAEDRETQYYEALEDADNGDPKPLLELTSKNLLRIADRYLRKIREATETEEWIAEVTDMAVEKTRDTLHRRYVAWDRQVTALKSEFQELGNEVASRVPDLKIGIRDYQGITLEQFSDLNAGKRVEKTWIFGVDFEQNEERVRFVFWATKRRPRRWDPEVDVTEEPVVLVSMEDRENVPTGRRVFFRQLDDFAESMITLREVVARNDSLARRRFNPVESRDEWDFDLSATQIARDFLQETLRRLSIV